MKQTYFIQIVAWILIVFSGASLLGQDSALDDAGNINNPLINPRANACYSGASLAGLCATQADWECGWALIRFEHNLLPRSVITGSCAFYLPDTSVAFSASEDTISSSVSIINPTPGPIIDPTTPGPVVDPTATPTSSPVDNDPCYFYWARYPLPALGQRVKGLMQQEGLKGVSVSAGAFGEDCISYATGQVKGFLAMETDFDVSVSVADLADAEDLDMQEDAVRDVLNSIPKGDLSGGRLGYVYITFVSPTGETRKIGP